jgi:hypothetical protein
MFGWFRIPKRVVDGRAQPELIQEANVTDVRQDLVIVVREDASAPGRRLPDGRVVSYEIPAREKG